MERWTEALADLEKLLELSPSLGPTYAKNLAYIKRRSEEKFEKDKEEMMEKLKGGADWLLGKVGLSTDNFKFEQDPSTGNYNIKFEPAEGSNPNFQFNMGGDKN